MRTEAPELIDELPEDFTSAWATVVLDLWERRQSPERRAAEGVGAPQAAIAVEGEADGE